MRFPAPRKGARSLCRASPERLLFGAQEGAETPSSPEASLTP